MADIQANNTGAKASTCHYVGTILTAEAAYDVYEIGAVPANFTQYSITYDAT